MMKYTMSYNKELSKETSSLFLTAYIVLNSPCYNLKWITAAQLERQWETFF